MSSYITSIQTETLYYKKIAERALAQVDESKIHSSPNANSNSVAVIIKHISGNMISRSTDFFTTDGEKLWRNRDAEFVDTINTKTELMDVWNKGWEVFLSVINNLKAEDLEKTIIIRNEKLSVIHALNRQLAHYAYHIGQLIYLCRLYCQDEWKSLTIPKGKSEEFNKKMEEKFKK